MLKKLKKSVYEANIELPERGLVVYTWGNVSGIDREKGLVVIKPSGVSYDDLEPEDMVVVDMEGKRVEGDYKPSSDTRTHLKLYKSFENIKAVVHTHSAWATQWAQSGMGIPCFGTTHADYFYGEIPCTRVMTGIEIDGDYELETGNVIAERFKSLNPDQMPAVLVDGHGPFTWGKSPMDAVHNSVVLEEVAKMAYYTLSINPDRLPLSRPLLDRHYLRKHGNRAYYGQA